MTELLAHLESLRSSGRKLLVPYLMGGFPQPDAFRQALTAACEHADAIEIGLPYSDPLMDGPVIASAGQRVIRSGLGPAEVLELTGEIEARVPLVVMTYYNPVHRMGEQEFCRRATKSGMTGLIVPDLPLEESESLRGHASQEGLGWVSLVAPTSPPSRVLALTAATTGFVYAVSTLGVTGARDTLSPDAERVVAGCRRVTKLPVLLGIGVSNAAQARAAAAVADGVVIGSALVRELLEGGAGAASELLAGVREALDSI
jgi:tryptophan synthase alpha chain